MFKRSEIHNQFKAFCKGSEPAFAFFFNLYNIRMYYFVLRKVKNRAQAREITENVFTLVLSHFREVESCDHLLALLYYFSRKCSSRQLLGLPCMDDGDDFRIPAAEDVLGILEEPEVVRNESKTAIQAEIRELSSQRMVVVEMKFYLQMDVKAIAAQLNIVNQTVRNHLSESMKCLKKKFGEDFVGEMIAG